MKLQACQMGKGNGIGTRAPKSAAGNLYLSLHGVRHNSNVINTWFCLQRLFVHTGAYKSRPSTTQVVTCTFLSQTTTASTLPPPHRTSKLSRPSWRACCTACKLLTPPYSLTCFKSRSSSCTWEACGACVTPCQLWVLPSCIWCDVSQQGRRQREGKVGASLFSQCSCPFLQAYALQHLTLMLVRQGREEINEQEIPSAI